jgi:hypothetical protein
MRAGVAAVWAVVAGATAAPTASAINVRVIACGIAGEAGLLELRMKTPSISFEFTCA